MPIDQAATLSSALDLDELGDEIAQLSAHLDAATARLLGLIREFDARGGWQGGFRSCAEWLAWRVGLDPGAAREKVRVARALGDLPALAGALEHGEISYSKLRAITRVATRDTEARLLAVARAGTASHVERVVRAWRHVDRQTEAREAAQQHARRGLQVYPDDDGMFVIRGRLEPEAGALLLRALDAAREALYQQSRHPDPADAAAVDGAAVLPVSDITCAQRQADALALIAQSALAYGLDPGTGGDRYQVVVHVDAPVLASPDQPGQSALEDGLRVSAETSRRLACDASRVVMRHGPVESSPEDGVPVSAETSRQLASDASRAVRRFGAAPSPPSAGRAGGEEMGVAARPDLGALTSRVPRRGTSDVEMIPGNTLGGPLDVGRRTRTIPPALRRALVHRDRGCRFPGCGVRLCQGHHVRHWANGGETRLGNVTLLCHRHHRAVHEEGYQVEVGQDGALCFRRPDGRVIPEVPPSAVVPADPVGALTARHRRLGLAIDPQTSRPTWQGERLDLGWAIDVLHPAAVPTAG